MMRRASAGQTARLLLRYHRDPSRYRTEAIGPDAPRIDFDVVLRLAQKRDVTFGSTSLEGASPEALHDAAAAYVRNVCFRVDATPYQTLGLAPDASAHAIKERFRLLMLLVHPDRHHAGAAWPADCATQANRAYAVLRSPETRAKFDREERERVQRARDAQQAAVAAAASTGGTSAHWRTTHRASRPLPEQMLPEWLTNGVGGFVRAHPAGVAFGGLIAASALVAGVALWDSDANSLMRKTRASAPTVVPEPLNVPAPSTAPPQVAVAAFARPTNAPAKPRDAQTAPAEPEPRAAIEVGRAAPAAEPAVRLAPVAAPPPAAAPPLPAQPRETNAPPEPAQVRPLDQAMPVPAPASPAAAPPVASNPVAPPAVAPAPPPPTVVAAVAPNTAASAPMVASVAPSITVPEASARAPTTAEIESFFVAFVDAYDRGRGDALARLFDDDARANNREGRAAIRSDYDDLFRQSDSRQLQLMRMNWRRTGDVALANGEIAIRVRWRDGRQVEQRMTIDMELARRDGRIVITRLAQRPSAP